MRDIDKETEVMIMMMKTGRRTWITSGAVLLMALVFLVGVWLGSLALLSTTDASAEDAPNYSAIGESAEKVDDSAVTSYLNSGGVTPNGTVDSAAEFCALFMSGTQNATYKLGADFKITATNWYAQARSIGAGTVIDGDGHYIIITANETSASGLTSASVGGLANVCEGKIQNLHYYFDGAFAINTSGTLNCGGLFAQLAGTGSIENCPRIEVAGALVARASDSSSTINLGGVIGLHKGKVINSTIISSLEAQSVTESKHCIQHAGGVSGYMEGSGSFEHSDVKTTAVISVYDYTKVWGYTAEYNDKEHVHPAAGVIGAAKGGTILNNTFNVAGSASSTGNGGSSNKGSIAGGFIGLLDSGFGGTIKNNYFSMKCLLSALFMADMDSLTDFNGWVNLMGTRTQKEKNGKHKIATYGGEWIGRSWDETGMNGNNICNNVILINDAYNDMIEGIAADDLLNDAMAGLLCGSNMNVGTNNWFARKLAECDTGKMMENSSSLYSQFNQLNIYGDGKVVAEANEQGDILMEVREGKSPFYGWTDDPAGATSKSDFNTSRARTFTASAGATYNVLYLFFIDDEIGSSGELTQFAYDVNLIKKDVWKNLFTGDTSDGKIHFNGSSEITLKWLSANVTKDITVKDGTPVIEDFYGKFYGNGHTISFQSGSNISHDYEKPYDSDDEKHYASYTTGLFGTVKAGARIEDLKIAFGGSIKETSGLTYEATDAGKTQLQNLKETPKDETTNTVASRTKAKGSYTLPGTFTKDTAYAYFFTGDGYSQDDNEDWKQPKNPGYVEVIPYECKVMVENLYVGVLAGKNYGTITGVDLEIAQSGSVTCHAQNVFFGGLCGYNCGEVSKTNVTIRGQVFVKVSGDAKVGGMFGENEHASFVSSYEALSVYIVGAIEVDTAVTYHAVKYYQYESARTFSSEKDCEDAGYTMIAYDNKDKKTYVFGVKSYADVKTPMIKDDVPSECKEIVGILIGEYKNGAADFENCVASSGDKSIYNNEVIQCAMDSAKIGGMIGSVDTTGGGIPRFINTWAVMSAEEKKKDDKERQPIAQGVSDPVGGINIIYVSDGISFGSVDLEKEYPITFDLEAIEGMTFAGWYSNVEFDEDGSVKKKTVITSEEGLNGSSFTPQSKTISSAVYYARMIKKQVSKLSDLKAIAETTNEGRGYENVVFTLANSITIDESFTPIGTEEHRFLGTLSGNGLTLTVTGIKASALGGVFGCIGSVGTVKNLVIEVTSGFYADEVVGIVAAYNYGTIGQDSSNGKVIVRVKADVQAPIVGGLVGVNYGTVKNCEVEYAVVGISTKALIASDAGSNAAYVGGAVALNHTAALTKNIIVKFASKTSPHILSSSANYYAGGAIGFNEAGGVAYSLVVEGKTPVVICGQAGSHPTPMDANDDDDSVQYRGFIIGKNASQNVEALWGLYTNTTLGSPVEIYRGEEKEPSVMGKIVLISGEKTNKANILVMYGDGNMEVTVDGNESEGGGQISFFPEKKEDGADFYNFVADFDSGKTVSVEEGNTVYKFAPIDLTSESKVYYAVFANARISSAEDYAALAARINADGNEQYRAYVQYYISGNFELPYTTAILGKDEDHPFRGSINGNGYTVTMTGKNEVIHAFVGVLGDGADAHHYSAVSNLSVVAQAGTKLYGTGAGTGILTNINNGTITGVSIYAYSVVKNLDSNGSVGGVAGVNNGDIISAFVSIEYREYLGTKSFGCLIGENVGGVAGLNKGMISDGEHSVEVNLAIKSDQRGALYGTETAGGLVGMNYGSILRGEARLSGILAGKKVGGIAGVNGTFYDEDTDISYEGVIEQAIAQIAEGALYFASEHFGGVAGVNKGRIGADEDAFTSDVKVSVAASNFQGELDLGETGFTAIVGTTQHFGGVTGLNETNGSICGVSAEITKPVTVTALLGGVAGENKGTIKYVTLTTAPKATLVGEQVGGMAADHSGTAYYLSLTFRADIGALGVTNYAGGFAAISTGNCTAVVVSLYGSSGKTFAFNAATAGLATANHQGTARNAWVQVSNGTELSASVGGDIGFNVIRVLNDTLLRPTVKKVGELGEITFDSILTSNTIQWYTDISDWDLTTNKGVLVKSGLSDNLRSYTTPATPPTGVTYYVCYDALYIGSGDELIQLSIKINDHDYYRGVRFVLSSDLNFEEGNALTPIGTPEHPFNAIFDGNNSTIIFESGSIISGKEYAGFFGYTSAESMIFDLVVDFREGSKIGSVNSRTIGAFIGESHGVVRNVYVNLATKAADFTANSAAKPGAFAGAYLSATDAVDCWIAISNRLAPPIGGGAANARGVNVINIMGNGALDIESIPAEDEAARPSLKYYVPEHVDFDNFANWYTVSNWYSEGASVFTELSASNGTYGALTANKWNRDISIIVKAGVKDVVLVLSFIETSISTEDDFIAFANNINQYGDQGATFTLDLPQEADGVLEVDFNKCPSVGTKAIPFSGVFEGNGNTIKVKGNLIKRDYAGVFGYVVGGTIRNVIFALDENLDEGGNTVGVKVGDKATMYAGVAAAYLCGALENVVVTVKANSVVYTTQGAASTGGLVGRADEGYSIVNSWLVIAEGSTVTRAVGEGPYYLDQQQTYGVGRLMQQVGEGVLQTEIIYEGNARKIRFTSAAGSFYGFIDNTLTEGEIKVKNPTNKKVWTVDELTNTYVDQVTSAESKISLHMLAVFIEKNIGSYADLKRLSSDVRMGRNFYGITYELTADILVEEDFIPIGGEFKVSSGASVDSYALAEFIGALEGAGHTITLPAKMNAASEEARKSGLRYAGLFGRLGEKARIKNLCIEADGEIGYDTGDNTSRTVYAGVLAGYASGGTYQNIFIHLGRNAALYGATSAGRVFGYLPKGKNVLTNGWVISYNSRANYEMNAAELAYNANPSLETGNQGGANNIMVIAAGDVEVTPVQNNQERFDHFELIITTESSVRKWYALNDYETEQEGLAVQEDYSCTPPSAAQRTGYNLSFLDPNIETIEQLEEYAKNINAGYDFYKLTFTLTSDLAITAKDSTDDFISIGTYKYPMNGTFDGNGHTVTLTSGAVIAGEYAGIFGYVGADGIIKNVRFLLQGVLGDLGGDSTIYAGAIARNGGSLENVLVVSDGASLVTLDESAVGVGADKPASGFVIGRDDTNLLVNVWGLVDASNDLPAVGAMPEDIGVSDVNTLKVIGVGTVKGIFAVNAAGDAEAAAVTGDIMSDIRPADYATPAEYAEAYKKASYRVTFYIPASSVVTAASGWYKSYKDSAQISEYMLSGGKLTNKYLVAPTDMAATNYEVAVIKTEIETVKDLRALAEDVNVGGYSFKNVTFSLNADIKIESGITSVGYWESETKASPFEGIFLGAGHSITVAAGDKAIGGIFGNNAGEIRGLTVYVKSRVGNMSGDRIYGGIANRNTGLITGCKVVITDDISSETSQIISSGLITGYTVGGVAGVNYGTIEDCIVRVEEHGVITATSVADAGVNLYAGGVAGVNYGTIEGTSDFSKWGSEISNVVIIGSVTAGGLAIKSGESQAGGIAGYSGSDVEKKHYGVITRMIASIEKGGKAEAYSFSRTAQAGGIVGYADHSLNHNVMILRGSVLSNGNYAGGTAGYLKDVTVINTWQLTYTKDVAAVGFGARQVNRLVVKGNGTILPSISFSSNSILFTDVNDAKNLDGWYESGAVVSSKVGNIGEGRKTFLPEASIQNRCVEVVFVNTRISNVSELVDMASSVSGGLSGTHIVFTLENDITVDQATLEEYGLDPSEFMTIGTASRPFNNAFNGNGHTITLSYLGGEDYVGLFGYLGTLAEVYDLKVVLHSGTYGSADAEYTAVLAAYSYGAIRNVEISASGVTLRGKNVAVLAGASFGTVLGTVEDAVQKNVKVTFSGEIKAESTKDAYAGGLIAKNEGKVSHVTLDISGTVSAVGAAYSYAGLVAAKNISNISVVSLETSALVKVGSDKSNAGTSYAGLVAGLNHGKLEKIYTAVNGGGFKGSYGTTGGLIGNNAGVIVTSYLELLNGDSSDWAATDSAIGVNSEAVGNVKNVWVYTDSIAKMSKVTAMNGIVADQGRTLVQSAKADILAGNIAFEGNITGLTNVFGLFARIDIPKGKAPVCEAGTGAVTQNVTYDAGKLVYTSDPEVAGVKALFTVRNAVGSGEELMAFAMAVNSGEYALAGEFSLTKDFTLPSGAFTAIGTEDHPLSAAVTVKGGDHIITVGEADIADGLFGVSAGAIENVGLRLTTTGKGTLVKKNSGALTNAALYLDEGVTASTYFTEEGTVAATAWVIVRSDSTLVSTERYSVLKIRGKGKVRMQGATLAVVDEDPDMIFIGFTDGAAILDEYTAPKALSSALTGNYTAEFISKTIDGEDALRVLGDAATLGYDGKDVEGKVVTFTFSSSVTVTAATLQGWQTNAFYGTLNGNGKTLAADGALTGALFGKMSGLIRDLRIDLTSASAELALFDAAASLERVVILENRDELHLGVAPASASIVVFDTKSLALYESFTSASAYSVIYENAKEDILYTFSADGILASEKEHASQVFAGWTTNGAARGPEVKNVTLTGKGIYTLNFINRTLSSEDDLVRLAEAVAGGFTFTGETFTVSEDGFTVEHEIPTIGAAEGGRFEGNIQGTTTADGSHNSEIRFTASAGTFLYSLTGTLRDVIFRYTKAASAGSAVVYRNEGVMSAVVVVAEENFAEGATLVFENEGQLNNCWSVTVRGDRAIGSGSRLGVNEIKIAEKAEAQNLNVQLKKTNSGTLIRFAFAVTTGRYLALYDYDDAEKVIFLREAYSYKEVSYVSPVNMSGVRFEARSLHTVSSEDELKYFSHYASNHKLADESVITLAADVTVTDEISTPLAYKVGEADYHLTFDLGGYTLTIKSNTVTSADFRSLFTSEDGLYGTVKGGTVRYESKSYHLATANTLLENVALHLPASGVELPSYTTTNCLIVTPHKAYFTEATKTKYTFYYYPTGAAVKITLAENFTVEGEHNAKYYYASMLGSGDVSEMTTAEKAVFGPYASNEYELLYAPSSIASAEDYTRFALANHHSISHFAALTTDEEEVIFTFRFSLDADIALAEGFRPLTNFRGELNGGHTVTVTGGTYNDAVFSAGEGGKFSRIVLAFTKDCSVANDKDMIAGDAEHSAVIVYQGEKTDRHVETTALDLNVYKQGSVLASFEGETLTFKAEDIGEYALYSWETVVGDVKTRVNDEGSFAKKTYVVTDEKSLVATFDLRYSFSLAFADKVGFSTITDSVLSENANDLPTFELVDTTTNSTLRIPFENKTALCFQKDFTSKMAIKVSDIGRGFMLWDLSATEVTGTASAWTYNVSAPASGYAIVITAVVTYVKMAWYTEEYAATNISKARTGVISDIETAIAGDASYKPFYTYENLGSTPPCVYSELHHASEPYHVGNYRIHFVVEKGGKTVCDAYSGLTITPVTLNFVSVSIAEKVYDGKTAAYLTDGTGIVLSGYKGSDADYIETAGLTFAFFDANVGVDKPVRVGGTGSLSCKAGVSGLKEQYTYLDYTFDSTAITGVKATITKRPLRLEIGTKRVDYLSQFGVAVNPFLPSNADLASAGLVEEDLDLYYEVVSDLLTREDADIYKVGNYRIIVSQKAAFDRLSNYFVTLAGEGSGDPYYIVEPSKIKVTFDAISISYGDTPRIGGYTVEYKGEEVDLSALKAMDQNGKVVATISDVLYFENVVFGGGATLIPSETKYGVRCLFSKEKNKNYELASEGADKDEYEAFKGDMLRVITQAGVLSVTTRKIVLTADDAKNSKVFGRKKEKTDITRGAGSASLASASHKIVASREAGETVGRYALIYDIMDYSDPAAPVSVLDYYDVSWDREHVFEIKRVKVRITLAQTKLIYGESVGDKLKYTVIIDDGSISVKDLYAALHGTEKADATLSDIGIVISYNGDVILNVGDNQLADLTINTDAAKAYLEGEKVDVIGDMNCIVVQPKYLTITIAAGDEEEDAGLSKRYDGTGVLSEVPGFSVEGLLDKDRTLLNIYMTQYLIDRGGVKVGAYDVDGDDITDLDKAHVKIGTYKVGGTFALTNKNGGDVAKNYAIRVVQGTLIVTRADARVTATVGYFNEDGSFTQAKLVREIGGNESSKDDTIFYGDTRAVLCFTLTRGKLRDLVGGNSTVAVPNESTATAKEISDFIEQCLNISYNKLSKIPYEQGKVSYDSNSKAVTALALASANSNYNVTFTSSIHVARVNIKVTLLKTTKTIGDSDPTINYELTAFDPETGEEIADYFDYARDAYTVTIVANRTEGETLGKYTYSDIVIEVANAESGEVLTENVETDESGALLVIKQPTFLKTIAGKILIYGGSVLLFLGAAIFLILYFTKYRAIWKNRPKKAKKSKKHDDDDDDEEEDEEEEKASDEASEEENGEEKAGEEVSAAPAEEKEESLPGEQGKPAEEVKSEASAEPKEEAPAAHKAEAPVESKAEVKAEEIEKASAEEPQADLLADAPIAAPTEAPKAKPLGTESPAEETDLSSLLSDDPIKGDD